MRGVSRSRIVTAAWVEDRGRLFLVLQETEDYYICTELPYNRFENINDAWKDLVVSWW